MLTLALDVDGVLLDSDRGGAGHWSAELTAQLGITRAVMQATFFEPSWADVIVGRRLIEDALGAALAEMGSAADVESVLACWFDADFVPIEGALKVAHRAAAAGHRLVLATNQERRRAEYLRANLGSLLPLDDVLCSGDLGYEKNDPQFFELASERLAVSPAERSSIVFVDDRIGNVDVARSCGWQAVHATGDETWHDDVAVALGISD